MIVCEELFARFGEYLEGDLTKVKLGKAARFRLSDIESLMQRGSS